MQALLKFVQNTKAKTLVLRGSEGAVSVQLVAVYTSTILEGLERKQLEG